MRAELEILRGGLLTTVQDSGRFGYQQYGMGTAGVMDPFAYKMGNLLVGNQGDEACLEATFLGPELLFHQDVLVAVTGGAMSPRLDGEPVPLWQSFFVKAGGILEFDRLVAGCRSYLCVAGGIQVPPVMGSRSTYLRGSVGGFQGRKLEKGDRIPLKEIGLSDRKLKRVKREVVPAYPGKTRIRAVPGPQDDYFTAETLETFFSSPYKVTQNSDRMGFRLDGPLLKHKESADIISDGIPLGAVQVPGHGNPIIMLADRQTTGGYAKIAAVITADLHRVAQLKAGDEITFQKVSLVESYEALKEYRACFEKGVEGMAPGGEAGKGREVLEAPAIQREGAPVVGSHRLRVTVAGKSFEVLVEELSG